MKMRQAGLECQLKKMRQARGWTQSHLAELVGIKRQAVYDIESGRYVPNTAVALQLAKHLDCTVEEIFTETVSRNQPLTLIDHPTDGNARVTLARVRDRLVGYPLGGTSLNARFEAADGLLTAGNEHVELMCDSKTLDQTVLLLGCDPAFGILDAHVSRHAANARVHARFASSQRALEGIAAGQAHLAGTHLHNKGPHESNAVFARKLLGEATGMIVGFSRIEEGLMVAPGNPHGIRTVTDLTQPHVRLVNRDEGAGLRILLDDYLARAGVPTGSVTGYENEVKNHAEGANRIRYGAADAALGLRAVADTYGLDFVPIAMVRCDLVIPGDFIRHPTIRVLLDTLQSQRLRKELSSLPGYDCSQTGAVIAELS